MKNKKPFSPEEFRAIYSKVPRLCVELAIKTPEGIVLTLRSLPTWKGKWHIPGGTVFYQEKVADALQRVALEELNIQVNIVDFLGYIDYGAMEEKERGFGWSISLVFLCHPISLEGMRLNSEASELKIFKELPDNMIGEQRAFLELMWQKIK